MLLLPTTADDHRALAGPFTALSATVSLPSTAGNPNLSELLSNIIVVCSHSFCYYCFNRHNREVVLISSMQMHMELFLFYMICMEYKAPTECFFDMSGCTHVFCNECIVCYVTARVEEKNVVADIQCPDTCKSGCLDPESCHLVLPPEVLARWGDVLCELSLPVAAKFYCPYRDCSGLLLKEEEEEEVEEENKKNKKKKKKILETHPVAAACIIIGVMGGLNAYMYALGSSYLPLSTSSLLISTQLAFTAGFAYLFIRQRFMMYSVNAVVLLVLAAVVLGL